jgi:putative hydrolase of the HAD superfamily
MPLPRAVLFDMDDTLLDYYGHVDVSWRLVCAEFCGVHGGEADAVREAIRRESITFWQDESAVGHWRVRLDEAREHVVRLALESQGLDPARAHELAHRYREEVEGRMALFDDALETLDRLRSAGLQLGIITNGPREMQRAKITRFELEPLVDTLVIEGEFGRGKPDPAVFTHALGTLGIEPGDAWMVGDNLYADIGGAQSVGIHAAWLHRDRLQRPEAPHATPDREIATLRELCEALFG